MCVFSFWPTYFCLNSWRRFGNYVSVKKPYTTIALFLLLSEILIKAITSKLIYENSFIGDPINKILAATRKRGFNAYGNSKGSHINRALDKRG